ncbi:MAG: radical SAM protein, partial [Candidatus Cloacimonetes bacterium]|nr:radical SAM protein [Candidatus Cloacimonadota bacterium]
MQSIYDFTLNELETYFLNTNEKKYRAGQIYEWLYQKKITNYEKMTNLSKVIINNLKINLDIKQLKLITKQTDSDANKYLFELTDGHKIETVLMKHDYGNSVCISTQIGCNMGCSFCESGKHKKVRDLTAGEMVLQVLQVENDLTDRVSSVVLMGIGEPFDNYDNVIKFIKIINASKGLNIGIRHITISTCGLVPK